MQVSDLVQFHKNIDFEIDGENKNVGFVSASIDRSNLQYNFNIQIFNKEFYTENTKLVTDDVMSFFDGVSEYLNPTKESEIVKALAYQDKNL